MKTAMSVVTAFEIQSKAPGTLESRAWRDAGVSLPVARFARDRSFRACWHSRLRPIESSQKQRHPSFRPDQTTYTLNNKT